MVDTAYLKLCGRVADYPEDLADGRSVKRRCIVCGNWVWSDPKADLPQLGTALHICEYCIPTVVENHLAEGDVPTCP